MASIAKYNLWQEGALNGGAIDWDTDLIKVMLVTASYTPAPTTDEFISDADANEVTGSNYTAGGDTVDNISVVESAGTVTVDGDDVAWLQHATGFADARYAIIYYDTTVNTTSPVVGYIDFTADKGNVNGDLTIEWAATGIFTQS